MPLACSARWRPASCGRSGPGRSPSRSPSDKGLLVADATLGKRAYDYRSAGPPEAFLAAASHREAQQVIDRYGDAALAAFAARLDALTPEQRTRLEELEGR